MRWGLTFDFEALSRSVVVLGCVVFCSSFVAGGIAEDCGAGGVELDAGAGDMV